MSISAADRTRVAQVLEARGLAAASEACQRSVRAAYAIRVADPARTAVRSGPDRPEPPAAGSAAPSPAAPSPAVGATRLGGVPDLAVGAAWPRVASGRFANFLGQFDLADLAVRAPQTGLPPAGLLSVFVTALDSAAVPAGVRCLFTPPGAPLARAVDRPGADVETADEFTGLLEPIAVRFERILTLPFTQREFRAEVVDAVGWPGMLDLAAAHADDPDTIGRIGGYGNPYSGQDFRRVLACHRLGHPDAQWFEDLHHPADFERDRRRAARRASLPVGAADGGGWADSDALVTAAADRSAEAEAAWLFANREAIDEEACAWEHLLRIDSNPAMNLTIMEYDSIYLFVPTADLAAGRFDRVEAMVTQG